jgi:hypothetical protein
MRKTDKILWEDAILKVVEDRGGMATLKVFFFRENWSFLQVVLT